MSVSPPPEPKLGEATSAFVKSLTDILIAKYPRMVAICTGLSIIIPWLGDLFSPNLQGLPFNVSALSPYYLFAFFMVIGIAISAMRRPRLPSSIEDALLVIRIAKKEGKLSEAQIKVMYVALYKKVLADVELTLDMKKQIEETTKK